MAMFPSPESVVSHDATLRKLKVTAKVTSRLPRKNGRFPRAGKGVTSSARATHVVPHRQPGTVRREARWPGVTENDHGIVVGVVKLNIARRSEETPP